MAKHTQYKNGISNSLHLIQKAAQFEQVLTPPEVLILLVPIQRSSFRIKNDIALLFWITIVLCLAGGCTSIIKKDFIIPAGFKGPIAIIYDYPTGIDIKMKKGRYEFIIPDSGILLTKKTFNEGQLDEKFYSNTASGIEEIMLMPQESIDTTHIHVSNNRIETTICLTKKNISTGYVIQFFYIGNSLDSVKAKSLFLLQKHIELIFDCK